MVELSEEIIDVMKKIKDALKESKFEINHFSVGNTGAGGEMIEIDIRRHEKKEDDANDTCKCGHHTNDHSYPYPNLDNDDLGCDECDCKKFVSSEASE